MPVDVVMPRLSDSMTEGKVTKWLKKEGEHIEKGESIAEIETDKANMQLESFDSGTVSKILVKEGVSVPVGQPIALLGNGSQPAAVPPAAPAMQAAAVTPAQPSATAVVATAVPTPGAEIKASPLAKRIAAEKGVDLTQVSGTGPGGRIVREDVEAFLSAKTAETAAVAAPPAGPTQPAAAMETELVELTKMGVTIAERMTRSKTTVPHFYITTEVDMTAAKRMRSEINAALGDTAEISYNDLVLRASALTIKKYPRVNASFVDGSLQYKKQVNIGIAVALEDGLVVPVLKEVDKKPLLEIAAGADALIGRARSSRLAPGDYEGGTFTVSNLGMFGIDEFLAIINPPEVAILAIGAIKDRVVAVDGQVTVALRMRVSLSADHRVFYGAAAAQFLAELKRLLENPMALVI